MMTPMTPMTTASDAETLLAALRGQDARERAAARTALRDHPDHPEAPARRAEVARLLAGSLLPGDKDLARWLLGQEIAAHEAEGRGASEALYTLVAVVARFADPTDAPLLWRARQATPETRAGVDVEQMARAGVERVRATLRRLAQGTDPAAREAAQALTWLEHGASSGAFDDLPGYFAWSDERFGVRLDCPTCRLAGPGMQMCDQHCA